jgi:hypothetical protein
MRSILRHSLITLAVACMPLRATHAQVRTDPVLVEGNQSDVVIRSPDRSDAPGERTRLAALVQGCRERLDVSSTDSAAFVSATSPALAADIGAREVLVFAVLPAQARLVDCGTATPHLLLAATRGLRVTTDTAYAPDRDILQVIVRRGTAVLEPLDARRTQVRRLGPGGLRQVTAGWIQLAFDVSVFAPGASGSVEDLSIEVRTAAGGIAERIALPWSAVRQAWESGIAARRPQLPLGRMAARGSTLRARVEARAASAISLLRDGDSNGARIVLGALVATEPCFTFAEGVPAETRDLARALHRPAARCVAQRPYTTIARAALLPGFGRRASGESVTQRVTVAAAIIGGSLYARKMSATANDKYGDYLAIQAFDRPPLTEQPSMEALYGNAEEARTQANAVGLVAAVTWGAQIALAVWRERRYAEHLRDVQEVDPSDAGRGLGIAPAFDRGRTGLTIRWTF